MCTFNDEPSNGGHQISASFTDPQYIEPRMTQSVYDGIQRRRPMGNAELISSTHPIMSQNPLPSIVNSDCKWYCYCILLVRVRGVHVAADSLS